MAGEIQQTLDWLEEQSDRYEYVIVIAGNHEKYLDPTKRRPEDATVLLDWDSVIYLQDSSRVFKFAGGRKLKFFGSHGQSRSGNWVFEYPKGENKWSGKIDDNTDILITHNPPLHHLDLGNKGDVNLKKELWIVRHSLHIFGHIHDGKDT
jgi:hypothetical protein